MTKNGLRISTGYIIPTIPDIVSTWGIYQIVDVARFAMPRATLVAIDRNGWSRWGRSGRDRRNAQMDNEHILALIEAVHGAHLDDD